MVRYRPPTEWEQWVTWLAAGLHGRSRWRLPVIIVGILFARGRRTVTSWLRAAGIGQDFSTYYYFLQAVGRKTKSLAMRLRVHVRVCGRWQGSRKVNRRIWGCGGLGQWWWGQGPGTHNPSRRDGWTTAPTISP